jgi:hypothetical protein
MEIPKILKDEISNYCKVNEITNIDEFIVKMIRQGFTAEKYGAIPSIFNNAAPKTPVEEIKPISLEIPETIKKHAATVKKVKDKIEAEVKTNNKEISSRDQKNKKDLYGE